LHIPKNGTNKTCLLIDDDEDDKEIFCLAMAEADPSMRCSIASNGPEALGILLDRSFTPDFIFLDLNMPLMNGKECLREIRRHEHLRHIPVVIFSTSSMQKDIQETKELGASSFITKPPLVSTLAQKLSEFLNSKRNTN
jgi:CheY-like chemotaxis protein